MSVKDIRLLMSYFASIKSRNPKIAVGVDTHSVWNSFHIICLVVKYNSSIA